MSAGQYSKTDDPDGSFTLYCVPSSGPTPTPAPTPTPTPAPTAPPVGNPVLFDIGAQNASLFMNMDEGQVYYCPLPTTANAAFNVGGAGGNPSPTNVRMAISDAPGGGLSGAYPQCVTCDPNGGGSIYWSLNPQPGRGGPYQAQITADKQWYLSIVARVGSGSISHNWN